MQLDDFLVDAGMGTATRLPEANRQLQRFGMDGLQASSVITGPRIFKVVGPLQDSKSDPVDSKDAFASVITRIDEALRSCGFDAAPLPVPGYR